MLTTIHNNIEATSIAVAVMQELWKPIKNSHKIQTTAQWFNRLNQPIVLPTGFPATLIDKAKGIAIELHQSMGEPVLLHGDLHHFNILSANRQPWLAIDPKGVVGEREYEVGALLRNPAPDSSTRMDTRKLLARRVDMLAEILGFDRQKIRAWGFSQAVLAAVWCIDSKANDWGIFLKCAEALN